METKDDAIRDGAELRVLWRLVTERDFWGRVTEELYAIDARPNTWDVVNEWHAARSEAGRLSSMRAMDMVEYERQKSEEMRDKFALALAAGPFTYYLPGSPEDHREHARRIYDLAEALNQERIRRDQAMKGEDDAHED